MLLDPPPRRLARGRSDLGRCRALASTLDFGRKLERSRAWVRHWLDRCRRPLISCSGGKDSTAVLQLVHEADPGVPVLLASPANPTLRIDLDRADHVRLLQLADPAGAGGWQVKTYAWDVEAVLQRDVSWPTGAKKACLVAAQIAGGADGLAWGLRREESRPRREVLASLGPIWPLRYRGYPGRPILTCAPIQDWTAEEVVGWLLATDRLPLNPVYSRTEGVPSLRYLRDNGWWPRDTPDRHGYRDWLQLHYAECCPLYDRAVAAGLVVPPMGAPRPGRAVPAPVPRGR